MAVGAEHLRAAAGRRIAPAIAKAPGAKGVPTRLVAKSFSGASLPLGLDRPFELRGGDRLAPHRLASELPLDWQPELMRLVADVCRTRSDARVSWFSLPPLALVGEDGVGRTHLARQIASFAGLPFFKMNVAAWGGDPGSEELRPPDVRLPPAPLLAMAASTCANPVVLVTGLNEASKQTAELLTGMIDPCSAERWVDQSIGATMDLSHVIWLLQVVETAELHRPLSALLRHVRIRSVRSDHHASGLAALSVLAEAMEDFGATAANFDAGVAPIVQSLRDRHPHSGSVGELYATAKALVLGALAER